MKIKCDDGIVRRFSPAYTDGDYLPGGGRQNGTSMSRCLECNDPNNGVFDVHSLAILKKMWKKHKCKIGAKK